MVMIDEDLSHTALSPVRVMANSTNNDVADFMIKNLETVSPLVIDNPDIVVLGNDPPSLSLIELVESDLDAVVLEEGSGPEAAAANDDVRTLNRRDTVSKGKAETKTSSVVQKKNPKANTDTIPVADKPNGQDAGSFAARLSGHYTQNLLTGLIERWTTEPPTNMKVRVTPSDSVVKRIVVGKFQGNAEVTFDRLVFAPIQVSSGTVEAKRMLLNLWSFTPDLLRQNVRRYPAQFDFLFKDCTFTENDLFESDSIRNGLRDLLVLVLQRVGIKPKQVAVDSIQVLVSAIPIPRHDRKRLCSHPSDRCSWSCPCSLSPLLLSSFFHLPHSPTTRSPSVDPHLLDTVQMSCTKSGQASPLQVAVTS